MKTKKYQSISLLNSEGDILKAFKTPAGFLIIDQHNEVLKCLNNKELEDYTRGKFPIIDSKGKSWDYGKEPGCMKPDLKKLDEFIGIDTTGKTY
jgi:hypothetical protein